MIVPISLSTTFAQETPGNHKGFECECQPGPPPSLPLTLRCASAPPDWRLLCSRLATRLRMHAGFVSRAPAAAQEPATAHAPGSNPLTPPQYVRTDNPTRRAFEHCLASLEEAKFGMGFASGMAATAAVSLLLRPGDELVCSKDLYGGT